MIDGRTRTLCVAGSPVAHSLSPLMHNFFSESLGLNYCCLAFDAKEEDAAGVIGAIRALGIAGASVTMPLKKAVVPLLDALDKSAARCGACNNIVNSGGRLIGYNTDVYGVASSLKRNGADVSGKRVLVVGAGGAARAAVCALSGLGAGEIIIANRTYAKSEALAESFREAGGPELSPLRLEETGNMSGIYAVIQCSAAGMNARDETPVPDKRIFRGLGYAFDLVYSPRETRFLREARESGARTIGGITQLAWQGVAAYKLWTGASRIDEEIVARLEKLLGEQIEDQF